MPSIHSGDHVSRIPKATGSHTYWPSDPNKIPHIIYFTVYTGIDPNRLESFNNEDMISDHSGLIIHMNMPVFVISRKQRILT